MRESGKAAAIAQNPTKVAASEFTAKLAVTPMMPTTRLPATTAASIFSGGRRA